MGCHLPDRHVSRLWRHRSIRSGPCFPYDVSRRIAICGGFGKKQQAVSAGGISQDLLPLITMHGRSEGEVRKDDGSGRKEEGKEGRRVLLAKNGNGSILRLNLKRARGRARTHVFGRSEDTRESWTRGREYERERHAPKYEMKSGSYHVGRKCCGCG